MLYLAEVMQNNFGPTSESLEVKFFKKEEILWEELAFPFVKNALDHYFNDLKNGKFSLKIEIICNGPLVPGSNVCVTSKTEKPDPPLP